ncbi:hypothetical protein BOTBODRAFT_30938 [Botryobasidium botryosum FD-172 SS1]|uniref:Mitochondrial ATP synthase epsilon chain domain-containing protein n=1 Tax=Botryobasidium botryosum (strain FD-172 SS1) TaxID=930990 RepID=A0A067MNB6_BOTB1|nr:hypothetical protein BOTBODRAFT_30938 [Botryobasidium botryosum FD-172 SS1]
MSSAWRTHITFNKYSQIAARAVRNSLKESERVKAEKRGLTALRYQKWEDGKGGEQVWLNPPEESKGGQKVV